MRGRVVPECLLEHLVSAGLPGHDASRVLPGLADRDGLPRTRADQREVAQVGARQGQRAGVVFQQGGGVLGGLLDDLLVSVDRLRGDVVLGVAVEQAESVHLVQDVADRRVDRGQADRAGRDRGLEVGGGEVGGQDVAESGAGHLHVQAGVDEIGGLVGAPVGGDEALEAQFAAQDPGQRL